MTSLLDDLKARPIGREVQQGREAFQRVLLVDIETYPALTYQWGLWDKFTPIERIVREGGVLSWAAKWYAEEETQFSALWTDGKQGMAERMWELMTEADVVVTYNGTKFDLPWLRTLVELDSGLGPVAPFANVDLYHTVKQFRFLSNKLDFVVRRLDIGQKVQHRGFSLWPACMPVELGGEADPEAQAEMEAYNRGDVPDTLEPLYDALLPWVKHPHVALYADDGHQRCQNCGHISLVRKGEAYTPLGVYPRFRCEDCGKWHRGKTRIATVDARAV